MSQLISATWVIAVNVVPSSIGLNAADGVQLITGATIAEATKMMNNMQRYITVKRQEGELLCSLDTETGECLCAKGVTVETDDYEEVFDIKDGKFYHIFNDH